MNHKPPRAGDAPGGKGSAADGSSFARSANAGERNESEQPARSRRHRTSERGLVAPQLARLRHVRGLSQAELAARAGVSVATISRLEQGSRAHYSTLDLLAAALDTTRDRLIKRPRRHQEPPSPRVRPAP